MNRFPILLSIQVLCMALGALHAKDATVTMTVVVRDYLSGKSSEVQVTGKLWDSTAGSWVGARPQTGRKGLPAEYPIELPDGRMVYRHPLSPSEAELGWPGRIAARLDMQFGDSTLNPHCSASLVGHKFAMTAAHCVLYLSPGPTIQEGWISDSVFLRPGFNLGKSAPGYDHVRVTKATVMKSKFPDANPYEGDDEWALLELEKDVGTDLGWARVIPINYAWPTQWVHMMGYPQDPPKCQAGVACDQTSKKDTLCHSWSDTYFHSLDGPKQAWYPMTEVWGGESGSGAFNCPESDCSGKNINVFGVRWTQALGVIDSVTSGIIAAILKNVKVPPASVLHRSMSELELREQSGQLRASMPRDGEWQILSLDGRTISPPTFGRNLSVPLDRLPRGVALIVFRAPGQVPVMRRWVGR